MAFLSDQVNQNGILLILVSISDKNYAAILIYRKNTGIYHENIGIPLLMYDAHWHMCTKSFYHIVYYSNCYGSIMRVKHSLFSNYV